MTTQERERLRQQLVRHEGLRLKAYRCPSDRWTIGVGRNIQDVGITEEEAYYLLDNDLTRCIRELTNTYSWFAEMDTMRQRVMIDLNFNLGMTRLAGFKKALAAITAGNYELAANELKDSQWARQVGKRADWLCQALVSGEEPPRV